MNSDLTLLLSTTGQEFHDSGATAEQEASEKAGVSNEASETAVRDTETRDTHHISYNNKNVRISDLVFATQCTKYEVSELNIFF